MKEINIVRDIIESIGLNDDSCCEVNFYSSHTYANCDDNLLIGKFYIISNIGALLMVQSFNSYSVKYIGKGELKSCTLDIYLKDI